MVENKVGDKTLRLVRGDITLADVDAFVYDITADCKLGSGYGGAIATRGGKGIQDELNEIGACPTGQAVVTSAGNLKAKFIIHVNGPKFHEPDAEGKLRRAMQAALFLADQKELQSVAFPPIGSGLYQVPLDLSARVMLDAVRAHFETASPLREVTFVAGDSREYTPFAAALAKGN